jgi:hypothetical protein
MSAAVGCWFGYVGRTTPTGIRTSCEFTKHPYDALGGGWELF